MLETNRSNNFWKTQPVSLNILLIVYFQVLCNCIQVGFLSRVVLTKCYLFTEAAVLIALQPTTMYVLSQYTEKFLTMSNYKTYLIRGIIIEAVSQMSFSYVERIDQNMLFVPVTYSLRIIAGIGGALALGSGNELIKNNFTVEDRKCLLDMSHHVIILALITGPICGGFLFDIYHSIQLPIQLTGGLYLLTCVPFSIFHDPAKQIENPEELKNQEHVHRQASDYYAGYISLFFVRGDLSYLMITFTVYLQDLGYSAHQAGICIYVISLFHFGITFVILKFEFKFVDAETFAILSLFLLGISFLCLTGYETLWLLYIASICIGIATGSNTAICTILTNSEPSENSEEIRVNETWNKFSAIGRLLVAVYGCIIIDVMNSVVIGNICIAVCTCAMAITWSFIYFI